MDTEKYKNVMIFGVFDGLHNGHKFFIESAKKYSSNIYIVVTPTRMVQILKNKLPYYSIKERIHILKKEYEKAIVDEGDQEIGKWNIIKKYKPDIIVCGYDQKELYAELDKIKEDLNFNLIQIAENFKGDEFHSSLLQKNV